MIAQALATAIRVFCGCQARWIDPPPAPGPRVYYANHTSHLDSLVLWSALPAACRDRCRIVAAEDYWAAGPTRLWLVRDVFRAVLIDRTQVTRSANPLTAMLKVLDAGEALVIFPEGGRSTDGALGEFRPGLWHLARKRPDVPLTPVWLENLSRVLPKGEMLPIPLISAVQFGPPFHWAAGIDKAAFLAAARAALLQLAGRQAP